MNYKKITDVPGCVIELSIAAIENAGEDATGSFWAENGCSFAVFDGCGGSGGQRYRVFQGRSGAYIASRVSCRAYFDWYQKNLRKNEDRVLDRDAINEMMPAVKKALKKKLVACKQWVDREEPKSVVGGSLMRSFPTTLAAIVCGYFDDVFSAGFLWAGDSRGYVLSRAGLVQMTSDDIFGGGDAMDCLRKDPPLTNHLAADGDFTIKGVYHEFSLPVILIVATDGCFDYFPSPMHFEHMLLTTMAEAASYEEWRENIVLTLRDVSADDFSMVLGCFGYDDYMSLRESFRPRLNDIWKEYIKPLFGNYDRLIDALWQRYKLHYYRRS